MLGIPKLANKKKATRRLSVTLPEEDAQELDLIAKKGNVTFAWVVRDAVRKYLDKKSNRATK